MPIVTLKAHFDGKAILLDESYTLPTRARLLVTLREPADDMARAAWSALSAEGLASAYAADGPDYGPADLKSLS